LAEAVTNHLGGPRLTARSAGSQPAGVVHPLTLQYLAEAGIATDGLRSQSWEDLEWFDPDIVITVCDSAAGEACPLWLGKAEKFHWGLEDPSSSRVKPEAAADAFRNTIATIAKRVALLRPISELAEHQWHQKFDSLKLHRL